MCHVSLYAREPSSRRAGQNARDRRSSLLLLLHPALRGVPMRAAMTSPGPFACYAHPLAFLPHKLQGDAVGHQDTVDDSTDQSGHSTRLFSAIQSSWNKLCGKLKKVRKGLPVKILFFLIGFYCATAFATVIGQTGDWDILSAGLAVAIVEAIVALMYRASGFVCISW